MNQPKRKQYPLKDNLAFKLGVGASFTALLLVALGLFFARWLPIWILLSIGIAACGLITYFILNRILVQRLENARIILRQFRKRKFSVLKEKSLPRGDVLDELIRQVFRVGRTLQSEITRLKKLENYRREFLGDVSHELRTPIFTIQGFAETLAEGALEDDTVNRLFLGKIIRNTERLNNLAEDLSAISQIETGEMEMRLLPFQLRTLIEEVIDITEPLAIQKNVQLFTHIPTTLPLVLGDKQRLQQVLINLVENAIKYNSPHGKVEILTKVFSEKSVLISVSDTGIGIPKQEITRITERFYRVDKSRSREQGGTGLGLAIAKHILEAHHQSLSIQSTLGKGSVFSFQLPLST